ncbi:MAG: hypothetical protein E7K72_24770 [Roseomonas mucosa]|nr:hypothetical protein [Roseomonas mucosa]
MKRRRDAGRPAREALPPELAGPVPAANAMLAAGRCETLGRRFYALADAASGTDRKLLLAKASAAMACRRLVMGEDLEPEVLHAAHQ